MKKGFLKKIFLIWLVIIINVITNLVSYGKVSKKDKTNGPGLGMEGDNFDIDELEEMMDGEGGGFIGYQLPHDSSFYDYMPEYDRHNVIIWEKNGGMGEGGGANNGGNGSNQLNGANNGGPGQVGSSVGQPGAPWQSGEAGKAGQPGNNSGTGQKGNIRRQGSMTDAPKSHEIKSPKGNNQKISGANVNVNSSGPSINNLGSPLNATTNTKEATTPMNQMPTIQESNIDRVMPTIVETIKQEMPKPLPKTQNVTQESKVYETQRMEDLPKPLDNNETKNVVEEWKAEENKGKDEVEERKDVDREEIQDEDIEEADDTGVVGNNGENGNDGNSGDDGNDADGDFDSVEYDADSGDASSGYEGGENTDDGVSIGKGGQHTGIKIYEIKANGSGGLTNEKSIYNNNRFLLQMNCVLLCVLGIWMYFLKEILHKYNRKIKGFS